MRWLGWVACEPICWNVLPCSLINPTVLAWLSVIAPWLCMSLLLFPYSQRKSCPAWGWYCCWEVDEHTGLWLGGTLQGHSWLQDEILFKISVLVYVILCTCISRIVNCLMECDEHVAMLNWCIVPLNNCNYRHLCMFSLNEFWTKLQGRLARSEMAWMIRSIQDFS